VTAVPQPSGWALASGRVLPNLLFVTSTDRLGTKIGVPAAAAIAAAIGGTKTVLDLTGAQTATPDAALAAVRARTAAAPYEGIVIVGGLDVVPAERLDTLTPVLAASVSRAADLDQFIVWSDDGYGSTSSGELPTLPASRIPDAGSEAFVWKCLAATEVTTRVGRGVRNVKRPFADRIWSGVPASSPPMPTSKDTPPGASPPYSLSGESVYLMLHGSDADGTRFWGEDGVAYPVAVDPSGVAAVSGQVVFTGCCWGALTTTLKASASPSAPGVVSRGIADSLALKFLDGGTRAFAGCTGTHYSPVVPPYAFNGGPLHEAFWKNVSSGDAPARALFQAKYRDYLPSIPHGQTGALAEAIERKIMFEYTSLGLGW
jgi:hypothetical protein